VSEPALAAAPQQNAAAQDGSGIEGPAKIIPLSNNEHPIEAAAAGVRA
jgi:hypothetical protein